MKAVLAPIAAVLVSLTLGPAANAQTGSPQPDAAAPTVSTAPQAGNREQVGLSVTVILASKQAGSLDKTLDRFRSTFERSFAQFKGFRNLGDYRLDIPKGSAAERSLVDGKKLAVRYVDFDEPRRFIRMEFEFDGAKMIMQVKDGGLWFHAGRKHGDGILILALTATTVR